MHASTGTRALVILASVLAPVIAGAIIYYSLKRTHSDLAHLGNWVSFAAFFLWPIAVRTGLVQFDGKTTPIVIGLLGIVLAIVAVRAVRQSDATRLG